MELGFMALALASVLAAGAAGQPPSSFDELRRMLPMDVDDTQAVALGDVDGDGDLDAVIGNGGDDDSPGQQNRLWINDGNGTFTDATHRVPADGDDTWDVALGDVDGDGDLDAVIGNGGDDDSSGQQNRLWINDGTGRFTDATDRVPRFEDVTRDVALGDVDGDGDLDAVIGNYRFSRLWLNDGNGRFRDGIAQIPKFQSHYVQAVALGDVDGDGDLDAVIGKLVQNRLWINDGTGRFTDALDLVPPHADRTTSLALGDVDGDGDLDAVIGNTAPIGVVRQNRLWLNDGTGRFADATARIPVAQDFTYDVALGDVDGDDDLDVVVGNGNQQLNRLWINDGAGHFTRAGTQFPATRDNTAAIAMGDVDGDGDLDAVVGNHGRSGWPNRLWLNDGAGRFTNATAPVPVDVESTSSVALGDVDGDGDLDALIGNSGQDTQNRLWINDGTGCFTRVAAQLPSNRDETSAVALADVDGDGDLDAVIGNWTQNRLWINDGSGRFTDGTARVPTALDQTRAVALGDVDADNDLDVLIGNWARQCRLWINDGSGRFTDATAQLPTRVDYTRAVALGDVDADGDLDAVIGNVFQNRLWINDGKGRFTDATARVPTLSDSTLAVALGDVDADGDLDALIGNVFQNRLWINDGKGRFSDATARIPTLSDSTLAMALGDVDADGDLDAVIGNGSRTSGEQNRLWLNDGSGRFRDAPTLFPPIEEETSAVALGDVDGDGDLDAVIGNGVEYPGQQNRVWQNLTRQLARRALPRIGKPLTIDVYGSPFGVWLLLASLGTADIRLPIGTLRLDPTQHVQIGAGLLDRRGRAAVTDLVPNAPSLIGVAFHWQAVVTVPIALTNLETTTFTNL